MFSVHFILLDLLVISIQTNLNDSQSQWTEDNHAAYLQIFFISSFSFESRQTNWNRHTFTTSVCNYLKFRKQILEWKSFWVSLIQCINFNYIIQDDNMALSFASEFSYMEIYLSKNVYSAYNGALKSLHEGWD